MHPAKNAHLVPSLQTMANMGFAHEAQSRTHRTRSEAAFLDRRPRHPRHLRRMRRRLRRSRTAGARWWATPQCLQLPSLEQPGWWRMP